MADRVDEFWVGATSTVRRGITLAAGPLSTHCGPESVIGFPVRELAKKAQLIVRAERFAASGVGSMAGYFHVGAHETSLVRSRRSFIPVSHSLDGRNVGVGAEAVQHRNPRGNAHCR